jgi:hypothetical protein
MNKTEIIQSILNKPFVGWVDLNPTKYPNNENPVVNPDGSVYYEIKFREESNKAVKMRTVMITVIDEGLSNERAFFTNGELTNDLPNDDFKTFVSQNFRTNPLAQFHGLIDYTWHLYFPYKRTGVIIGQCKKEGWSESDPSTMVLTLKGFSVADDNGQLIILPHDVASSEVAKFSKPQF